MQRTMYIWKLKSVLDAEGGVTKSAEKAKRAKLSAVWVKIADGKTRYSNVTGSMAEKMTLFIEKCHDRDIGVWGWQVPHCPTANDGQAEAETVRRLLEDFALDGIIMDAEGGGAFFQGDRTEAAAYAAAMRNVANAAGKPLAISSNDIPQNIAGWLPRFNKIAVVADFNFPQVYYGGSPSVVNRLDRAEDGNSHITIPFQPIGAAWIGDGGCSSGSACAERARQFISLVHERGYDRYGFWHWAGAPLAFWEVLNTTPV